MSLIKKAYFMLIFLNLKSFSSNLFFCSSFLPQHAVYNLPALIFMFLYWPTKSSLHQKESLLHGL